ncbi:hypothetical protein MHTCC0001_01820 [Flavobacteriaceae bacterium MHTCC 0001]
MKNSILIIATALLCMFNLNANNNKMVINITNEIEKITSNNIVQVFEWTIETTENTYSGTALSLQEAKRMIGLSSTNEIIIGKTIESFFVLKSEINTKRNYFWEVETATGKAKGYSSSEAYAHQMIKLVASGDTLVSKIIISQPQQ